MKTKKKSEESDVLFIEKKIVRSVLNEKEGDNFIDRKENTTITLIIYILTGVLFLFFLVVILSAVGLVHASDDIMLNITSTPYDIIYLDNATNATVNATLYRVNYTLFPNEMLVGVNQSKSIAISNFFNSTQTVSFDLIGLNASFIWSGYDLAPNVTKFGVVKFTQTGIGFFKINISGLNTSILQQPAIHVNVTERLPQPADYYLNVRDCVNFTKATRNESSPINYTLKDYVVCVNASSVTWDDLNPEIQTAELNRMSQALQGLLGFLGNRTSAQNTTCTDVKYYWEVVPEAQSLLTDLRNMKSCDTVLKGARDELTLFYGGEIGKLREEIAGCTDAKKQALEDMAVARTSANDFSEKVIKCEKDKIEEVTATQSAIRQNEVAPALFTVAAVVIALLSFSIWKMRKNSMPDISKFDRLERKD